MDAPPTAAADAPAGNEATVEDNDLDIDEADLAEELEKAMQEDEQPGTDEEDDDQEEEEEEEEMDDEEAMQRNTQLLALMTEEELDQFAAYRRATINRGTVRRMLAQLTGQPNVPPNTVIVVQGITKVFVGELIETARRLATQWGDKGPLLPVHIHTAYGLLDEQGRTIRPRTKRRRF